MACRESTLPINQSNSQLKIEAPSRHLEGTPDTEEIVIDSLTYKTQFTSERFGEYGGAEADIFIYNSLGQEIFKLHSLDMDIGDETVVLEDFNFDGKMDIAVQNGHEGGYGSSSWDIYVQQDELQFELHPELTSLMHDCAMGLYIVHPNEKRLETYCKSGAAIHYRSFYAVKGDKVIIMKIVGSESAEDGEHMIVYTEERVNGKMKRTEKKLTFTEFEKSEYY